MKSKTDQTCTILHVHPIFPVDDLALELEYYQQKLGFEVSWLWGDPPSRAGVLRDGIELQLVSDPAQRPGRPGKVYCQVVGIEALFREYGDSQAKLTSDLGLRPWGMLDFRVEDLSGNQIGFGEAVDQPEG